jgi:putative transcriptional regulator
MITQPSDEILLKYTSGVLDPALRLLVDRHFEFAPETRGRLDALGEFGATMLAGEAGEGMAAGSLDRVLARLGQPFEPVGAAAEPGVPTLPPLDALAWRWAGPGRAIANIEIPDSQLKTYALRIAPGKAMLQHSHAGDEWTLILQGAYRDESGEYHAGAFIEEDEETDHRPVATGARDCICLAVMSGPLTAPGLMGKVARWLMR